MTEKIHLLLLLLYGNERGSQKRGIECEAAGRSWAGRERILDRN